VAGFLWLPTSWISLPRTSSPGCQDHGAHDDSHLPSPRVVERHRGSPRSPRSRSLVWSPLSWREQERPGGGAFGLDACRPRLRSRGDDDPRDRPWRHRDRREPPATLPQQGGRRAACTGLSPSSHSATPWKCLPGMRRDDAIGTTPAVDLEPRRRRDHWSHRPCSKERRASLCPASPGKATGRFSSAPRRAPGDERHAGQGSRAVDRFRRHTAPRDAVPRVTQVPLPAGSPTSTPTSPTRSR